jgi:serine protease Do
MTRICRFALLAALLLTAGIATAQDDVKFKAPELKPITEKLPAYFSKQTPETVDELKAIQDHVAKVVDTVMPAVVSVRVGQSFGSGVIVSRDGYILTAGHVSGTPDRDVTIYYHNGKIGKGKTLGGNHGIDSGMIKVTGTDNLPFVDMGDSSKLKNGDWCLVIAHHGGYKTGRSPPVRLGRILNNDEKRATVTTDAMLVGGDSGGPLFDMHGRVIGINSRIGNSLAANMHVSVNPFRDNWDKIAKGEVWGGKLGGKTTPYIGIEMDNKDGRVLVVAVEKGSPADKAGLQANDIVVSFDGKDVSDYAGLAMMVRAKRAGDQVVLEIRRGDETLTLKIRIGQR